MGLPALLLAYAAGLAIAPFFISAPLPFLVPLLPALLWIFLRKGSASPYLLALTLFVFGVAAYSFGMAFPAGSGSICSFAGDRPVIVEGRVSSVAPRLGGEWHVELEAEKAGSRGIFAPVEGGVRLYVEEGEITLRPGERVRFRARLRLPRVYGTPGEFDMPRHLAARDIFVTAFVEHGRDIAVLASAEADPTTRILRWRRTVAQRIDGAVTPELAPMVKALAIGESSAFPQELRELLARGGVSHLFAISGQHLTLIALFLFLTARAVYVRSETLLLCSPPGRIIPFLLLPLLYGYLLLTGAALPTQRAFLTASAGVLLLLSGRNTRPLKVLSAVAFIMLLAEPLALFEASFQLSFAGVFGIVAVLPRWQPRLAPLPRPARWVADLFLSTVAATVATTPLVLLHFHLLAPAGVVTNLAAVPAVGLGATLLAFFGTVLVPLWPAVADLLFRGSAVILETTLAAVQWTVALPGLSGWRIYPSLPEVAAAFLFAAALLAPGGTRLRNLARGALLLAGGALLIVPVPSPDRLTVTAISVGQGDSVLLSRPGGRHYLIDGGGSATGVFDPGERLVAPALGHLGVRRLEAVVLTHDHPDHSQGLIHILENFPVKAFWSAIPDSELPEEIGTILKRRGIPARCFDPGWTALEKGELALHAPPEGGDTNDLSLALYARQEGQGVLLTGDLERDGVEQLLGNPPPGPVTLLKLPHHGSRRSSPELLLDAFHPQAAFVSAGAGNTFGFPHTEVVEDLAARKIPLFRTDRGGTVRLWSEEGGWRAKAWRKGLFR